MLVSRLTTDGSFLGKVAIGRQDMLRSLKSTFGILLQTTQAA